MTAPGARSDGSDKLGHDVLVVPQGEFVLHRYPERTRAGLRAWDSADSLLLHRVAGVDPGIDAIWAPAAADGRTLIIGDAFGALTVGLAARAPATVIDSYCSRVAVRENLESAGSQLSAVEVRGLDEPLEGPGGGASVDLVVIRPPRQLALLEHALRLVVPLLDRGTLVVAADMVRHVHSSTLEVFERVIGPTCTTRALRRARLIESRWEGPLTTGDWSWPQQHRGPHGLMVTAWPGVFAAGRTDRATELLADHLPAIGPGNHVVDLGCGDGVLGTLAAVDGADVTFVDDSALAVKSARATFLAAGGDPSSARFVHGNSLFDWDERDGSAIAQGSVDLVVTNPPFHEHRAMGDAVAWQMFVDSHRALRPGGELLVVGNRHLAHHAKLRRIFGNCDVVASTSRYVVVRSLRR